jgi:hypothetical protein
MQIGDLVWVETSPERPDRYQCRITDDYGEWITVIHPPDATWKTYFFICTLRREEILEC